jgi:hypothetical protein
VYLPRSISRLAFSKSISACFTALCSSPFIDAIIFCCSNSRILSLAALRSSAYSFALSARSFADAFSSESNFFCSRLNNLRFAAKSVSAFATSITAWLTFFFDLS